MPVGAADIPKNPQHTIRTLVVAGIELAFHTDDDLVWTEFVSVFGGDESSTATPIRKLTIHIAANATADYGTLSIAGHDISDPAAFLLGFASPTVPMVALPSDDPSTQLIGMEGADGPLFMFRDGVCWFRKVPRWRRIVAHVIFLHALHERPDVLFFHAASIALADKGVLFVGPKGSGKSTVSLALASRNHALLGDETAAYESSTGLLLPMQRPVGIKPGPRAQRIDDAMQAMRPSADEDGMTRIPVRAFFREAAPTPVPLRAVVFLDGFAETPSLTSVTPGREELASMQPLRSTTFDRNQGQRVFQMIRLLGGVQCYRLTASDPDYTAKFIEERLIHDAIG